MADFASLLEARLQEFGGPFPDRIDDGIGGFPLDTSLMFDFDPSTYSDGDIATQPLSMISADLDTSLSDSYTSVFSDEDDLDTNDDFSFSLSLLASTPTNSASTDVEIGYDELTIAYDKFPLYTWPSDRNQIIFPFNCWKVASVPQPYCDSMNRAVACIKPS